MSGRFSRRSFELSRRKRKPSPSNLENAQEEQTSASKRRCLSLPPQTADLQNEHVLNEPMIITSSSQILTSNEESSGSMGSIVCFLCLNDFTAAIMSRAWQLQCAHTFCATCITVSEERLGNIECPLCEVVSAEIEISSLIVENVYHTSVVSNNEATTSEVNEAEASSDVPTNEELNDNAQHPRCFLCQDDFKTVTMKKIWQLKCSHTFCATCVKVSPQHLGTIQCPVCKVISPENQISAKVVQNLYHTSIASTIAVRPAEEIEPDTSLEVPLNQNENQNQNQTIQLSAIEETTESFRNVHCFLCLDDFTMCMVKRVWQLQCSHTFCEVCLQVSSERLRNIDCPVCESVSPENQISSMIIQNPNFKNNLRRNYKRYIEDLTMVESSLEIQVENLRASIIERNRARWITYVFNMASLILNALQFISMMRMI